MDTQTGPLIGKRKISKERKKVERRGKVVLPYVKKVPENIAKIFKRHDIETIHKPSATLKNLLCNKMKDKVDVLDKTGVVYHNECIKKKCRQEREKDDYVGETERVTRERLYEHRIISRVGVEATVQLVRVGGGWVGSIPYP